MARQSQFQNLVSGFTSLFAVWIGAGALLALVRPGLLLWLGPYIGQLMKALVFSMGMTARPEDFRACLQRPRPAAVNFLACFIVVPALALGLSRLIHLPDDLVVGMVLVGSVNGGSASNLIALLAGADVALSVLMTVSTTVGAVVAIPLATKLFLGAIVSVDTLGLLLSAVKFVVIPISLGVTFTSRFPRVTARCEPAIPAVGVLLTVFLIGAVVASCAEQIWEAGVWLHIAVFGMHIVSGAAGYALAGLSGGDERERRTVAIEVGLKNSVLAGILARLHFENIATQTPAAVACIWGPFVGSAAAAVWQQIPLRLDSNGHSNGHNNDGAKEWAGAYRP